MKIFTEEDKQKWIDGFEGSYSVKENGTIVSHKYRKNVPLKKTFMKSKDLYVVNLSKEGKTGLAYVHRIVAKAFVPNPFGLSFVGFIDGKSRNCKAENLFWH